MYPYILCVCGRDIGSVYDLFKLMKAEEYAAAIKTLGLNVDPEMMSVCNVDVKLDKVLKALNINLQCCRVKLLTQVEFKNM